LHETDKLNQNAVASIATATVATELRRILPPFLSLAAASAASAAVFASAAAVAAAWHFVRAAVAASTFVVSVDVILNFSTVT